MGFTHRVPWCCSTSAYIHLCLATANTLKHASNTCKLIALNSLQAMTLHHGCVRLLMPLNNKTASKMQQQKNYNPSIIRIPKMLNYCEPMNLQRSNLSPGTNTCLLRYMWYFFMSSWQLCELSVYSHSALRCFMLLCSSDNSIVGVI